MKANPQTLKNLFDKDVRYLIPDFQRPYVWDQEKQWGPLCPRGRYGHRAPSRSALVENGAE